MTCWCSTQLEFTVHQWQLCLSSNYIGLAPNSTGIYLFYFVFGFWPCDTRVWLIHCFLTWAIIVISPAFMTALERLLQQLCHCSSHIGLAPNFTGIRVIFYCVSSLKHIKWLLMTVLTLDVLLTLAMLLMHLLRHSCRYMHLVPTLVAHQMVSKQWNFYFCSCTYHESSVPHYTC